MSVSLFKKYKFCGWTLCGISDRTYLKYVPYKARTEYLIILEGPHWTSQSEITLIQTQIWSYHGAKVIKRIPYIV